MPTTWDTDWDNFGVADHTIIALDPISCCIHKASIITIPLFQHSYSHKSNQHFQSTYNMSGYYFLVWTDYYSSMIIDGNEVQFMWRSSLIHGYLISIVWDFYIMFVFHKCSCYFLPELTVLFVFCSNRFIVGWWTEYSSPCRWLYKFHMFLQIVNLVLDKTWFCVQSCWFLV